MLVTFLVFALLAVLGLAAFLMWMWPSSQRPSTVPGMEPSDPNSGNLGDIQKMGSFHDFLVELHNEFGPVASFYYGQKYCVSLGSAETLRQVENCFDRPLMLFEFVKPLVGAKSVQFANGPSGRAVHKTMAAAFSHQACAHALPKINAICAELTRNWAGVPTGEHLPLRDYMMALAIRMISSTHFGAFFRDDGNTKALHKLYESVMDAMDDMLLGEFDPEVDRERNAEFQRDLAAFQGMVKGVVRAHRAARREGDYEPAPFLDTILDQYGDDEEFLASNAITVMVGGFHTTGNFLTWVMYYLAIYPHMQEKIFEEIQEVLGPNAELDTKMMDKLKYLNAFLSESHRHANMASFVAKEWSTPARRVAGHLIPEGTPILQANTVAFQDQKYFPDPNNFDPARFLDEAENRKRPSTAFAPFGFGPRKCMGYRLAHFESVAAVIAVVRRFVVRTAFEDDFYIEQTHGFVCKPASEIWVKIRSRS